MGGHAGTKAVLKWRKDVGRFPYGRKVAAAKPAVADVVGEIYGFGRKVAEDSPRQEVTPGSGVFAGSDGDRHFFPLDRTKNLRWRWLGWLLWENCGKVSKVTL